MIESMGVKGGGLAAEIRAASSSHDNLAAYHQTAAEMIASWMHCGLGDQLEVRLWEHLDWIDFYLLYRHLIVRPTVRAQVLRHHYERHKTLAREAQQDARRARAAAAFS